MKVVIEIDHISELEEISEWLARQEIVIQQSRAEKISAGTLFNKLRHFKIVLPVDHQFNRHEANER